MKMQQYVIANKVIKYKARKLTFALDNGRGMWEWY